MSTMTVTTKISYKYLMNKSKHDLTNMIFEMLDDFNKKEKEIKELRSLILNIKPTYEHQELSYDDRIVWGTCPICDAKPGKHCSPSYGLVIGYTVSGYPPKDGVHLERLKNAPITIAIKKVD